MAQTSNIKLTFGYADETKRDFTIGPFATNASAISGAKANIISFNENELDSVKNLLLSDDGATCTGIIAASIISVTETDINLNDAE